MSIIIFAQGVYYLIIELFKIKKQTYKKMCHANARL